MFIIGSLQVVLPTKIPVTLNKNYSSPATFGTMYLRNPLNNCGDEMCGQKNIIFIAFLQQFEEV
jgi:hypothetical protein